MRILGYQLEEKLGEGGMAVVFRAHHHATQRAVAIKVLRNRPGRSRERSRALLREEIKATARLVHPNVVDVLDVGTVPRDLEIDDVVVRAGQDFLVMELVAGGALDEIPALTWPEIKNVLIHLLAGLAHAHARGVIHRDLKPANVLVDTQAGAGPWLPKIADFGLAHLDPDTTLEGAAKSAGTPAYMAPEQISGTLRDHGASTDLYALGCIAYELVAGRPPFDDPHYLAVLQHHLDSPVPPLPNDAIAPPGFESWLARLMLKNPRKRFQHAADAAWALLSLAALETGDTATRERASTPRSTTVLLPTLPWGDGLTTELDRMEGGREPNTRSARPVEVVAPPMPQRWREDHDREVLKRTGVALHGARPTPLLERREEQRLLWEELRIVRRTGEPRCVVIRGEEGAGKTRLTDWFAAQTEELGIATAMRVQHDRVVTQFHGMPGLFRRYFRIGGMDAEEARARVTEWLSDVGEGDVADETDTVVDWIMRTDAASEEPLVGPELLGLGHRLCESAARHRPIVLLVDDAQWGPTALVFVSEVLRRSEIPLLAICAHGPLTEEDDREARRLLKRLADRDETAVMELSQISQTAQSELLTVHYGLQHETAVKLLTRSGGDVRFTEHLLDDAIQRGALVPGKMGWELSKFVEISLPEDVHDLMVGRIERFSNQFDTDDDADDAIRPLELAAVLGRRFDEAEWRRACEHAGIDIPPSMLRTAQGASLIEPSESSWSFVEPMLHETLLRHAHTAERYEALNRAAARAIEPTVATNENVQLPRYARHLADANRGVDALRPLVDGAEALRSVNDGRGALRLLDLFIEVADEVDLPVDERVVVEALAYYGDLALYRIDAAVPSRPLLQEALAASRRIDDRGLTAIALGGLAFWELCNGSVETATVHATEAMKFVESIANPHRKVRVVGQCALTAACSGSADDALRNLEQLFRELDLLDYRAKFLTAMNAVDAASYGGYPEELEKWLQRTRRSYRPGMGVSPAYLLAMQTQYADIIDDHDSLVDSFRQIESQLKYYERSLQILGRILVGVSNARHCPHHVTHADLEELAELLPPTMYEAVRVNMAQALLSVHADEPRAAMRYLDRAQPGLATGKVVFTVARDAEHAARQARSLGYEAIADRLARIAIDHWRGLGRHERAADCEDLVQR